jgi:hypothetical protein
MLIALRSFFPFQLTRTSAGRRSSHPLEFAMVSGRQR